MTSEIIKAVGKAMRDGAEDGDTYRAEHPGEALRGEPDEALINALGGEALGRRWGIAWFDADGIVSAEAFECCEAYNRAFREALA